jgi:hypothetical protein
MTTASQMTLQDPALGDDGADHWPAEYRRRDREESSDDGEGDEDQQLGPVGHRERHDPPHGLTGEAVPPSLAVEILHSELQAAPSMLIEFPSSGGRSSLDGGLSEL